VFGLESGKKIGEFRICALAFLPSSPLTLSPLLWPSHPLPRRTILLRMLCSRLSVLLGVLEKLLVKFAGRHLHFIEDRLMLLVCLLPSCSPTLLPALTSLLTALLTALSPVHKLVCVPPTQAFGRNRFWSRWHLNTRLAWFASYALFVALLSTAFPTTSPLKYFTARLSPSEPQPSLQTLYLALWGYNSEDERARGA
jgi:hypothetical protein